MAAVVPKRKSEHPWQVAEEAVAVLRIQSQDHFCIAAGLERIVTQVALQLAETVDGPVECDAQRGVAREDRLAATLNVDDAKPGAAERAMLEMMDVLAVGPAMAKSSYHAGDAVRVSTRLGRHYRGYATHGKSPPFRRMRFRPAVRSNR